MDAKDPEDVPVETGEVRVHQSRVQYYDGSSWVDQVELPDDRDPPTMRGDGGDG